MLIKNIDRAHSICQSVYVTCRSHVRLEKRWEGYCKRPNTLSVVVVMMGIRTPWGPAYL